MGRQHAHDRLAEADINFMPHIGENLNHAPDGALNVQPWAPADRAFSEQELKHRWGAPPRWWRPPNDNAKHEPLCYFTATKTLSSRRPGCTASTPSCAVAEGIDSTVFPVTLPPL